MLHTDKRTVETKTVKKDIETTASAFAIDSFVMFLFIREVSLRPEIVAKAEAKRIRRVTVLTPPAVPTGEPPINIRKILKKADGLVKFS